MKKNMFTRILAFLITGVLAFSVLPPVAARAELVDTSDNEVIVSKIRNVPRRL